MIEKVWKMFIYFWTNLKQHKTYRLYYIYLCVCRFYMLKEWAIFVSLIVPLYCIGCMLYTHNTHKIHPPPPNQRLYELYLWRNLSWRTYKSSCSMVVHTRFTSRIQVRWFLMDGITIFSHYFLWPWQIHLIKPWYYMYILYT